MSDFRIDKITNRDGSAGTQIAGISTFSGTSGMQLPSGPTDYRGGRGRAVRAGGRISPSQKREMDYVEIATKGNATDFGDLSLSAAYGSGTSSATRGIVQLGGAPAANTYSTALDYYTFSSQGGANEFGDMPIGWHSGTAFANQTRGCFVGGRGPAAGVMQNKIYYVTIATTGDASDFGDYTKGRHHIASVASQTRGVFGGGYVEPAFTVQEKDLQYVTTATKGNAKDFGDMFTGRYRFSGCSNTTRGLYMGGSFTPSAPTIVQINTIDYITIASLGNGQDFGDLTLARAGNAASASATRGLCMGGYNPSGNTNIIDYVTIATTGNASDFGDLTQALFDLSSQSDVHGGLG